MGQASSIPPGSPLDLMCRWWDTGRWRRYGLRRKKMVKLCTKTWPGYNALIENPEEHWGPSGSFEPGPLRGIRGQLLKHHIEELDYLSLWEAVSKERAALHQDALEAENIRKEDSPVLGVNKRMKTRRAPPPPPPVALPRPSPAPNAVQTSPAPVALPRPSRASSVVPTSPVPVALPPPSLAPNAVQPPLASVALPSPSSAPNVVPPSSASAALPSPSSPNVVQPSPAALSPPSPPPNTMQTSPAPALSPPSPAPNVVPPSPAPAALSPPSPPPNTMQTSPAPAALSPPSPPPNAVPPSPASVGPTEKLATPSPFQNMTTTSNAYKAIQFPHSSKATVGSSLQDFGTCQQLFDGAQEVLNRHIWLPWDLEECKKLAGTFETDPLSVINLLERMFSTYILSYEGWEQLLSRMLTRKELDRLREEERKCYDGGWWGEGKKKAGDGLRGEAGKVRLEMDQKRLLSHLRKMAEEGRWSKVWACWTEHDEPPRQFWSRLLKVATLACVDTDNFDDQVMLKLQFIQHSHEFIRDYFQVHYPGWCSYTTETMLSLAHTVWEEEKEKEKKKEAKEMAKMIKVAVREVYGNGGRGRGGRGGWRHGACYQCGKMGHIMRDCYWNTGRRW